MSRVGERGAVKVIWDPDAGCYKSVDGGGDVSMFYDPEAHQFRFKPRVKDQEPSAPLMKLALLLLQTPSGESLPRAEPTSSSGEKPTSVMIIEEAKTPTSTTSNPREQEKPTEPVRGILPSLLDKLLARPKQVLTEKPDKEIQESSRSATSPSSSAKQVHREEGDEPTSLLRRPKPDGSYVR